MEHRYQFKAFLMAPIVGGLLVGIGSNALADGPDKAKPLELRKIMQEMGKNMENIVSGISLEEWDKVRIIAPQIADHPQPSLVEKIRILNFVGADAATFKEHDEKTHRAALALEAAALRRDGQAVISSFATLQNHCLACHQSFRKPFVEHFYGTK